MGNPAKKGVTVRGTYLRPGSAATLDLLAGCICRLSHGVLQCVDGNWPRSLFRVELGGS